MTTCTVCWESIKGVQVSEPKSADEATSYADFLIRKCGHGQVHVHDSETNKWYLFNKGIRGRINECEIPVDEVPKPYQMIVLLGG